MSYVIHSIEVNLHIGKYLSRFKIYIKNKDQWKNKYPKGILTMDTKAILLNDCQWSHLICIPTRRYISLQEGKTIKLEN